MISKQKSFFFFLFFRHHQKKFTFFFSLSLSRSLALRRIQKTVSDRIIASQNRAVEYRKKHAVKLAAARAKKDAKRFPQLNKKAKAAVTAKKERKEALKGKTNKQKRLLNKEFKKAGAEKKKLALEKTEAKKVLKEKKKAEQAKKAVVKGNVIQRTRKARYSIRFRRPHTLRLGSKPRYPKTALPGKNALDEYAIVRYPLSTESAMKKIEKINTLTFIVDVRANKPAIKKAIEKLYEVKIAKVRTLIRPDNQKKAYVRLTPDFDALDVANKISIL